MDLHFLEFELRSIFVGMYVFSFVFDSDNSVVDIVADEMPSHYNESVHRNKQHTRGNNTIP